MTVSPTARNKQRNANIFLEQLPGAGSHIIDDLPTRRPQSPRIVVKSDASASNGLKECTLQFAGQN